MTDIVSSERRSELMRGIRSKDTGPERKVRSWLHRQGLRFRLNRTDLPGSPDIVLPKYKTAIFVHGCYWHRHPNCKLAYTPKTNQERWERKFIVNVERDRAVTAELKRLGWNVIIVWECAVRSGTFAADLAESVPTSKG